MIMEFGLEIKQIKTVLNDTWPCTDDLLREIQSTSAYTECKFIVL